MPNRFSSGKHSIAECDVCGFRFKLKELKYLTIKTKQTNIKACKQCWTPDQPQLQIGMYPVNDPQAVRQPRPDTSYYVSGNNDGGSRIFEWGWNPVGGASDGGLTPNSLALRITLSSVTVTTT
jgi:hypothetical protein